MATAGCGRPPHGAVRPNPAALARNTDVSELLAAANQPYRLTLPTGYDENVPHMLVVSLHGWGEDERSALSKDWHSQGGRHGYIVASPRGYGTLAGERHPSWNGGGASSSPGPRGKTCSDVRLSSLAHEALQLKAASEAARGIRPVSRLGVFCQI